MNRFTVYHFNSLLFFILLSIPARCQLASWIYPPIAAADGDWRNDLLFQAGSTQTLKWQSPYPTASITWFHNNDTGSDISGPVVQNFVGSEFVWLVSVDENIDLDKYPVFNLIMTTMLGNSSTTVGCHYFNITNNMVVTSTSSAPTSTVTSPATTSIANSSITPIPKTREPSTTSSVGIGVACTAAAALTVGIMIWYFRRLRNRLLVDEPRAEESKDDDQEKIELVSGLDVKHNVVTSGRRAETNGGSYWVHELASHNSAIYELPGSTLLDKELPALPENNY